MREAICVDASFKMVSYDFARQLERELSEANERAKNLGTTIANCVRENEASQDALGVQDANIIILTSHRDQWKQCAEELAEGFTAAIDGRYAQRPFYKNEAIGRFNQLKGRS